MSKLTIPGKFDTIEDGYIVIAPLSQESRQEVYAIQERLASQFLPSSMWLPKGKQLHITFAHIISPLSSYDTAHHELYRELGPLVIGALERTIPNPIRIEITFDTILANPSCVYLQGRDDGTFDALRKEFIQNIAQPEETRRPPKIIHTTIARFRDELDFAPIHEYVDGLTVSLTVTTEKLQLIHEAKIYAQDYDVIAQFPAG